MKRWMAIDYGTKRVGIALTDLMRLTAQPFATLACSQQKFLIEKIQHIIQEQDVEKIIVGLPLNMDDSWSEQTHRVKAFADALQKMISITVETWDERLTTFAAEQFLTTEAGIPHKKQKMIRDKIAACLILKSYMEHQRR